MSQNVFDIDHVRQVEVLIKELGGVDECKRLGFVNADKEGVMRLSTSGLGYLLFVKAADVHSLAGAFAAGWQCALDAVEDRK